MREAFLSEQTFESFRVRKIHALETESGAAFELFQPVCLELNRIIVVEIVDADDRMAVRDQAAAEMKTDESGCAGDQYMHETLRIAPVWQAVREDAGRRDGLSVLRSVP